MERVLEAFANERGDVTSVWEVLFSDSQLSQETTPCSYPQTDGSFRDGTVTATLEISRVNFRTTRGALQVGMQGQLSSPGDIFCHVTVLSISSVGEEDHVVGEARKRFDPKFD